HPLGPSMVRALECCADHGGEWSGGRERRSGSSDEGDAAGQWRAAFLAATYLRNSMIAAGVFSETFETAITWDRLGAFVQEVRGTAESALREIAGAGTVTCRFTHVYPDGAAPY